MDIKLLVQKALSEMTKNGLAPNTIKCYRTSGFNKIVRHFEEIGQADYSKKIIDVFVGIKRSEREADSISQHTWTTIYRSCELLELFHNTGKLILPTLKPWETINNPTLSPPTAEQLADNESVRGLVWRSMDALNDFALRSSTKHIYFRDGFCCILRKHIESDAEKYSKEISDDTVSEAYEKYLAGKLGISAYQTVRRMATIMDELYKTGIIKPFTMGRTGLREPVPVFASLLSKYCETAEREGRIKPSTINTQKSAIRRFLFELESAGHHSLVDITPKIVNDCISRLLPNYKGGTSCFLVAIRAFMKFLHESNLIAVDLSTSLPKSASPRRRVQQGFSADEINNLLELSGTTTALGKRNYAMMMLALQTGLRAVDIINLERQDINWRSYEIRIVQRKTSKPIIIPLETESGNAVADYLLNGRPESTLPYIFITHTPLKRPLKTTSVCTFIRRYILRTQTEGVALRCGLHRFRRTFATRILENEIPFDMLRQLLGQTHMDSTKPYMPINESALKKCALGLISFSGGKV